MLVIDEPLKGVRFGETLVRLGRLNWSQAKIDRLSARAEGSPHWFERDASVALLAAQRGEISSAQTIIRQALSRLGDAARGNGHVFEVMAIAAFFCLDEESFQALLRLRHQPRFDIEMSLTPDVGHLGAARWAIDGAGLASFSFSPQIFIRDGDNVFAYWLRSFNLYQEYMASWSGFSGQVLVNLWDAGVVEGIAFCSNQETHFLVPDPHFISHFGHREAREYFEKNAQPWDARRPVAYWRGSSTGAYSGEWRTLQRARLCEICNSPQGAELTNVGLSQVVQIPKAEDVEELHRLGVVKGPESWKEERLYKYQIDIDGNTNSWPGMFQRLLSGGAVLKVASPAGYRQWYYDRLEPWINHVPVEADMEDLLEKIAWLRAHDEIARRIGESGRELALSLEPSAELRRAAPTIDAAFAVAAGRPERALDFSQAVSAGSVRMEGWRPVAGDGWLWADGETSRIRFARPILDVDYLLEMDVDLAPGAAGRSAVSVTMFANGRGIGEAEIAGRATVELVIPLAALKGADELEIIFMHPDWIKPNLHSPTQDNRKLTFGLRSLSIRPARAA